MNFSKNSFKKKNNKKKIMENYDYIRTNLEQIEKSSNLNESSPYKYTNSINNNFVSKNSIFNKRNLGKLGILCGLFFTWSLIIVYVFYPKYIRTNDNNTFSWKSYLATSLLTFLSLVILYYFGKWLIKYLKLN